MNTVSPEAQAAAVQLLALLRAKTTPCLQDNDGAPGETAYAGGKHGRECICGGSARVPDPAYADLIAALQERCDLYEWSDIGLVCRYCGSAHIGYHTRDWTDLPRGSLEGVVMRNLPTGCKLRPAWDGDDDHDLGMVMACIGWLQMLEAKGVKP